ncbi:MAG TPA: hypothetical protein EYN70_09950, partial [Planctomycetaceae bacterium]|nr:hypothetical protein [Planctomycetaceae bacterium]
MRKRRYHFVVGLLATVGLLAGSVCLLLSSAGQPSFAWAQQNQVKPKGAQKKQNQNKQDGKNKTTGKPDPAEDPVYRQFGIYENTAPRAARTAPVKTSLPLEIPAASRIALVGNTLLERSRFFGHFETLLQQRFPGHNLVVR